MSSRQNSLNKLIARIRELGEPPSSIGEPDHHPVVSLEEFFENNDDVGSIACDLLSQLDGDVSCLYMSLVEIRNRPNVQDVLVEIWEIVDEDIWPVSDRVYILTSASEKEVESWVKQLQPSEVAEGYVFGTPSGAPGLNKEIKVYGVWWD